MRGMSPEEERAIIISWVRDGGSETRYDAEIEPIVQARCLGCHNGRNPRIPPLTNYTELKSYAQLDTGMSIGR